MKTCTKCHCEKPLVEFHKQKAAKDGHQSWCKVCNKEQSRKYCAEKRKDPEYHKKENERSRKCKAAKYKDPEYRKKVKQWYKDNSEHCKQYSHNYLMTEHGREMIYRKNAKRHRNLGWEKLFENPYPPSTEIDWHHISDAFIVAIPRALHRKYSGRDHRAHLKPVVEKLYSFSYIVLDGN